MRISGGNAELVVGARIAKPDQLDAAICIDIDQITVSRRARHACENADAPIVAVRHPINLLLEDRPGSNIARQEPWFPAARWRGQRDAVGCEALIPERSEMTPATDLELAGQVRVTLPVVPGILNLAEQKRRIVDPEIDAIPVTLLRIAGTGTGLVAVENRAKDGQLLCHVPQEARAFGRQRRRRPAAWQSKRRDRRPAHRGVGENIRVLGIEELAVGRQLSELER